MGNMFNPVLEREFFATLVNGIAGIGIVQNFPDNTGKSFDMRLIHTEMIPDNKFHVSFSVKGRG